MLKGAISFLLLLTLPSFGSSRELNELELFQRCYIHLTGTPVPLKDPRLDLLKKKQTTALSLCNEILEGAQFQTPGKPFRNHPESTLVVKQFFQFFRTWFPTNYQESILGFADANPFTIDYLDLNQPALALLYHSLKKDQPYRELLRGKTRYRALRSLPETRIQKSPTTYLVNTLLGAPAGGFEENIFHFRSRTGPFSFFLKDNEEKADPNMKSFLIPLPMTPSGDLFGVEPNTLTAKIPNFSLDPQKNTDRPAHEIPDLESEPDVLAGFGGGLIGTPEYFLLTSGHPPGTIFNGTTKLPRKWSQSVFSEFLCVNFNFRKPVRDRDTSQDLLSEVQIKSMVDPGPFRTKTACLQCHSALDPMANTARNLIVGSTDQNLLLEKPATMARTKYKNALVVSSFHVTNPITPSGDWISSSLETDPKQPVYPRTTPFGKLYYRNSEGILVSERVQGLDELGTRISEQDDYYQCAAQKFFQFLTGIDVKLYDQRDPAMVDFNKANQEEVYRYRESLKLWGSQLRKHQSIPELVKTILQSPIYRDSNFGRGGSK